MDYVGIHKRTSNCTCIPATPMNSPTQIRNPTVPLVKRSSEQNNLIHSCILVGNEQINQHILARIISAK